MATDLPPTYSQEPPEAQVLSDDDGGSITFAPGPESDIRTTQILIVPIANGVNFQKGYLGAEEERAAIEGELQIKSEDDFRWREVSVHLRTTEKAHGREIELACSEVILAKKPEQDQRSSFRFSIPLPADTPQCIHTSHSCLVHTLTAIVTPTDPAAPPLSKSLIVHTKRFTSHLHGPQPTPETKALEEPTRVEVQIPRMSFHAGEPIPLYVTVPVPAPEVVVEQGTRLRNIRAELVRFINVKKTETEESELSDSDFEILSEPEGNTSSANAARSTSRPRKPVPSSSAEGVEFIPVETEHGERKVISLSGASCRLHPSRPLRIRLVLHQPTESPLGVSTTLPSDEYYSLESDADCASISAATLLHSVSFRLLVHATFMNMANHTERVMTVTFPIIVLPPPAPLPEVEQSMDEAYHKKHDRPPTRTVRQDEDVPRYEAGPSNAMSSGVGGAPPPFEEREAPPPFSSAEPSGSTSTGLPTFLESESEIYVPVDEQPGLAHPPTGDPTFDGEGTLFGFLPSEQFDGYAELNDRSFTPPPTLEMATMDTDVTGIANMDESSAMEALGLAIEQQSIAAGESLLPPPPPLMDDPSDPPPSIDSAFRAPEAPLGLSPPQQPVRPGYGDLDDQLPPHPLDEVAEHEQEHGHAPPPYGGPEESGDAHQHGRVVHPPPYMDLVRGR